MTAKEVLNATIKALTKRNEKLSEMALIYDNAIAEIAEIISVQDGAISELAEIVSVQDSAIVELGEMVANLTAEIEILKGGTN